MNDNEFKELYDSCVEYCMKTLQQWIKNRQDAEDAFAEAISIYWIRYKQGKIKNNSNIKAYVLKIALNNYRSKIKADKRLVDSDLDKMEEAPEYIPTHLELGSSASEVIKEAFKKLSEDCRKMLTAKYVYGYKYEDIAEDMGRTSGNSVKVQTFRCAQYLMKMVKNLQNKMSY